jgi:hypothetical protein
MFMTANYPEELKSNRGLCAHSGEDIALNVNKH